MKLAAALFLLAGPAYAWNAQQQALIDRPVPSTPEGVQQECAQLRDLMQRQETTLAAAQVQGVGAQNAMLFAAIARSNAAAIRTRAANIGCTAAFGAQAAPAATGMTFDQCFAKCKQLTDRDDAACFDSCKR